MAALVTVAALIWSPEPHSAPTPKAEAAPSPLRQPLPASPTTASILGRQPAVIAGERVSSFRQWAEKRTASPLRDDASIPEGVRLAKARREALHELIATDPEAALALSRELPPVLRTRLPEEVASLLEERIDARGNLEVRGVTPAAGVPVAHPILRVAEIEGRRYDTYVHGRREGVDTSLDIPLNGIAIGGRLALEDTPWREVRPGEILTSAPRPMAFGEHSVNFPSETGPVYASGDDVLQFCCDAHAKSWADGQLGALGPGGGSGSGGTNSFGPTPYTLGAKKVLVIRAKFPDVNENPRDGSGTEITPTYIVNRINNEIGPFFEQTSYGQTSLTISTDDVTGVLTMPNSAQSYASANDPSLLRTHALEALATAGTHNPQNYDRVYLVFSNIGTSRFANSQFTWAGLGQIGAGFIWMNGVFDLRVGAHEMGHTYGLRHANLWRISSGSNPVSTNGTSVEYGDEFDMMGDGPSNASTHPNFFNPCFLSRLGWLPVGAVNEVQSSGTYRIYRFDHQNARTDDYLALKINRDNERDYWIGYRLKYAGHGTHGDVSSGAYLLWNTVGGNFPTNLIDVDTPTTNALDASLNVGQTLNDTAAGISITTTAAGGTGTDAYLDVTVNFQSRIQFTSHLISVDESAGTVAVQVSRSGSGSGIVTASYSTADGTATVASGDYSATSNVLTWSNGDTSTKTINIPIGFQAALEGTQEFTLTLHSVSGGVIVGSNTATIQIVEPGAADPGFSHSHFNFSASVNDMAVQPDGRIAFVGRANTLGSTSLAGLGRLEANGSGDTDFHAHGAGANVVPVNAIARQADGKLLVAGDFTSLRGAQRIRVARLNADGSLDNGFLIASGANGGPDNTVHDVAIQPDGKIVITGAFANVAGTPRKGIARLNRDGTLDTTFLATPISFVDTFEGRAVALQADGKVLAGGIIYSAYGNPFANGFASGVWRLNADGTFDNTFNIGTGAHAAEVTQLEIVYAIAVQPDGKVLVGGSFTEFNSTAAGGIVRLNINGSVDGGFSTGGGAQGVVSPFSKPEVRKILVQNTGHVFVGGTFSMFNGTARNHLARLSSTGVHDTAFDAQLPATYSSGPALSNWVRDLAVTQEGKLLVAQDSFGSGNSALRRVFTGSPQVAGGLEFTNASYSGTEGASASVQVRRVGGATGAISVSYSTFAGSATEGSDYTLAAGVLSWGNNDTSTKTINIPLAEDGVSEPVENFFVQLGTPLGGAWLAETAQAQVSINQAPTATISPPVWNIDHTSQSYDITVTSATTWTVSENTSWLSASPAGGTGNGTVTVTVEENPSAQDRSATIVIGGRNHILSQDGAPPFTSLNPVSQTVPHGGQTYGVNVDSNQDWTVFENLSWVSVTPTSGSGNSAVAITVQPNTSTNSRSGTVTIGGQAHNITQNGAPAFVTVSPLTKTVDSSQQSYFITVTSNGLWNIDLPPTFTAITSVLPQSGGTAGTTTSTSVRVSVANNSFAFARTDSFTVGGQTHTLTQQANPTFTFTVNPPTSSVSHLAQSYDLTVLTNGNWTVSETLNWVTVTPMSGGPSPTPSTTIPVTVTLTENTARTSRKGTINLGGKTHTVTQGPIPYLDLTSSLAAPANEVDRFPQTFTITVDSNVSWTVLEDVEWLSVSSASGTGKKTITVTVEENTALTDRMGEIEFSGTDPAEGTFTFTQAGVPTFTRLSPPSRAVPAAALTYPIDVNSNTDWTVEETLDWVSVDVPSGTDDGVANVTLTENTDLESRTGTVVIGGTIHYITQAGTGSNTLLFPSGEIPSPTASDLVWDNTVAGSYDGLLRNPLDNHTVVGMANLKLAAAKAGAVTGGSVSGTVRLQGRSYAVKGTFNASGALLLSLPQKNAPPLLVALQLVRSGAPGTELLRGTIQWGKDRGFADLARNPYNAKTNAATARRFTLLLPAVDGWGDDEPGGDGLAAVTVATSGAVTVSGTLGDGVKFTESAQLSQQQQFQLYQEFYASTPLKGRLAGRVALDDQPGISDGHGVMQWVKYPHSKEARYAAGFEREVWAMLSGYVAPGASQPMLGALASQEYNAHLSLTGTTLPASYGGGLEKVVTWLATDVIRYYGPEAISFKPTRASGLLTGSFNDTAARAKFTLPTIAYQKQNLAAGNFVLGAASGRLRLWPGTAYPYPGSEAAGTLTRTAIPAASSAPALTAVPTMIAAAAGTYQGILINGGQVTGGIEGVSLTATGAISGGVWIEGVRYAFKGALGQEIPIARKNLTPLTLTLSLARAGGTLVNDGFQLTGTFKIEGNDHDIDAQRRPVFTKTVRAPQEGLYTATVRMPDGTDVSLEPGGDGYGAFSVNYLGACAGTIRLAEGTAVTLAGFTSREYDDGVMTSEWSFHRGLYGKTPRGYVAGKVAFRRNAEVEKSQTLRGDWRWVKQNGAAPATVYPAGFDVTRPLFGSRYTAPAANVRAIDGLADAYYNIWLRLNGPNLSTLAGPPAVTELDRAATWLSSNKIVYYGPEKVALSFNVKNGLVSGSYLYAPTGINVKFGGVLLLDQDVVVGSYVIPGRVGVPGSSGLFTIEPR